MGQLEWVVGTEARGRLTERRVGCSHPTSSQTSQCAEPLHRQLGPYKDEPPALKVCRHAMQARAERRACNHQPPSLRSKACMRLSRLSRCTPATSLLHFTSAPKAGQGKGHFCCLISRFNVGLLLQGTGHQSGLSKSSEGD